jgi:class 3 adenylate cyclase
VTGGGPVDLAWQFDWFGNVDVIWEDEDFRTFFAGVGRSVRLIMHDRRATGLSSRNVAVPNLETRVADLICVLDEVGSSRPIVGGEREGGSVAALLAATNPEKVRSLVWFSPGARTVWSPDYPWGAGPEYVAQQERTIEAWGTAEYGRAFREAEAVGEHEVASDAEKTIGLLSRHLTTPDVARELSRIWYETDTREILGSIRVPALLVVHEEPSILVSEAEYVASIMPDARMIVLPGKEVEADWNGPVEAIMDFIGIDRPADLDSVLMTVLFTDIVGSTAKQASLGDRGWKELVERHHTVVRSMLEKWRGRENDTAGDGFYVTFDGPARAISCALEIADRVRGLGLEIRAGVHTGECELIDGKPGGIAVTTGSRISSLAGPSEVLVSETVKGLVAGSGFTFEDAGEHELKGVPDRWHLYRAMGR